MTLKHHLHYAGNALLMMMFLTSTAWANFEISTQLDAEQQSRLRDVLNKGAVSEKILNQAALAEQNTYLQVERLQLELTNTQQRLQVEQAALQELAQRLEKLDQQTPENDEQRTQYQQEHTDLNAQQQAQKTHYEQQQEQLKNLQKRLNIAQQKAQSSRVWYAQLEQLAQYFSHQDQQQKAEVEQEKQAQQVALLRKELSTLSDSVTDLAKRSLLEAKILTATEHTEGLLQEARLNRLERDIEPLNTALANTLQLETLKQHAMSSRSLLEQLRALNDLWQQKNAVLMRQRHLLNTQLKDKTLNYRAQKHLTEAENLFSQLAVHLQEQQEHLQVLLDTATQVNVKMQFQLETSRRQSLLQRRQLPNNMPAWQQLWQDIQSIPQMFWMHVRQAGQYFQRQWLKAQERWLWLGGGSLSLLLTLSWARRRMQKKYQQLKSLAPEHHSFSSSSVRELLTLSLRYLPELALIGVLLLFIFMLPLQNILFWWVLALSGVWLLLNVTRNLAWRLLVYEDAPQAYRDAKLYQQLSRLLWLTGLLTSVVLFIHFLPFSRPLKEVYDTGYLLFFSVLVWPLLRLRYLMLQALTEKLGAYWLFVLKISSLLFVMGIATMSLLALFGYINLAWALGRFLGGFLLLMTLWLVARGYLKDAIIMAKNYALQHSPHYGLLWTQDIIPLLHKLLQIFLVLALFWLLLHINGLHIASHSVQQSLALQVFNLGSNVITVGGLGLSLFAFWFVLWFGKWVRQITYRWIYIGVVDLGARHSLSAFTQYLLVIIGFLIALNIMGVDLTTLTVFAGALGVGLGFGLKNVADNFISGLLLLIERPLRTGDAVKIDNTYEGIVKQIGIRSLTINTWDNQDVIVPNSQLISAPFVNWSRDDWILRTVLYIGVSYNSDVEQVKAILESILEQEPIILKEPESDVYLYEFADSAINFRVQYYIDADKDGLLSTKSKVLLTIWKQFKQHDIEIPYPQRDIHVQHLAVNAKTDEAPI